MALRRTITQIKSGDVDATVHLDSGMGIGQQCWITAEGEDWRVYRTFWFDSYSEYHAENFVKKLAEDEDYRRQCINRKTEWARLSDAMKEAEGEVTRIFRAEHGAGTNEAQTLVEEMYSVMKDAEPSELDDIHARFVSRAEKRVEEMKPEPHDLDHQITFGKHEGDTLLEIAQQDPGYAEWGIEELDNRPELQLGLERALDVAEEKEPGGEKSRR